MAQVCRDCGNPLTEEKHKKYYYRRCGPCYKIVKNRERKRRYENNAEFKKKEKERALKRYHDVVVLTPHLGALCVDCKEILTADNHKGHHGIRCRLCYRVIKRENKRLHYATDLSFKSKLQERNRKYHKDPDSKLRVRFRRKKYLMNHPSFRIAQTIRGRIRSALKAQSNTKQTGTSALLGISFDQCRDWIQSQFLDGMTWDNCGTYWEIDHVTPCASFDLSTEVEQKACFSWSNIRPIPATENRIKGDKIFPNLIAEHAEKAAIYSKIHLIKS